MPRGEKNKLTEEQRIEIRASYGKVSGYKLAKRFGVSHTMVYKIWKKQASNQKKPNSIDTIILKKLIPVFATADLEVDLKDKEIKRIQELSEEDFK